MKKYLYILIGLLVVAGVAWLIMTPGKAGKYDALAKCIKEKGAIFYGAFWCPHCQAQKARFGKSASYLPYVECSTPDSRGQTPICIEKDIKTYPTWYFPTSTPSGFEIVTGEIEIDDLAKRTSCEVPAV